MKRRIFLSAALAGAAALVVLAFHAGAQQPPQNQPSGTIILETADGTRYEQTLDGKVLRTTAAGQAVNFQPWTTADGRTYYAVSGGIGQDPETLKMAALEQAAAQEARAIAAQYAQADSDAARTESKAKLREKLTAIFDLQQKRRAQEISQIEERLGKLKETMKKRDASKDPIIDRRLDQLTGGIDELGWEESAGASPHNGYGLPSAAPQPYPYFRDPNSRSPSELPPPTPAPRTPSSGR